LSDAGTYYDLPAGTSNVGSSDFIAHFPSNATIPAHGVQVISIDTAAAFHTATNGTATYSIGDGTMITVDGSAPTLTNTGEVVALFYWDGATDLVTDVDVMVVGAPTSGNGLFAKGGVAVDGPDAGNTPTAYPSEADSIPNQTGTPSSGKSTK